MNINWLEWLGYLASVTVLLSLLMNSIKRLRWINLVGSLIFSIYGFLIGSLPVGLMNAGICLINIYYIYQIYSTKEYFKILQIDSQSDYLTYFLDYFKADIQKYYSDYNLENSVISFLVLRNTVPAGVFICSDAGDGGLNIELDFVTPKYRDFRVGLYIFENKKDFFIDKGFNRFICNSKNDAHIAYLKKMGFEKQENNKNYYIKNLK